MVGSRPISSWGRVGLGLAAVLLLVSAVVFGRNLARLRLDGVHTSAVVTGPCRGEHKFMLAPYGFEVEGVRFVGDVACTRLDVPPVGDLPITYWKPDPRVFAIDDASRDVMPVLLLLAGLGCLGFLGADVLKARQRRAREALRARA